MPKPLISPVLTQEIDWRTLRQALRRCILTVAPTARVYSSWPLKYEIGQTINLLKSEDDGNKIHAWMISINEATPSDPKSGGYNLQWDLNVRIWGFVGYAFDHNDTTQDVIEEEARKISQIIYLNQLHLGMDIAQGLNVGELAWSDIDTHAFGTGSDVHVAQGNLKISTREHFSL